MATEMHCLGLNYTGGGGEHSFTVWTSVFSSERWGSNGMGLTQLCNDRKQICKMSLRFYFTHQTHYVCVHAHTGICMYVHMCVTED